MLRQLSISVFCFLAILSCEKNDKKSSSVEQSNLESTTVFEFKVQDLSASGSPFKNLGATLEGELRSPRNPGFIETSSEAKGTLLIAVANFCAPNQCFIGTRSFMSIRQKNGTSQRYERATEEPVEGLKLSPAIKRLAPRVLRAVNLWLQGLKVEEDRLHTWLKSTDSEVRRAGLQAILDRDLSHFSEQLTPLLQDEVQENRDLAFALAAAYTHDALLPALKTLALGQDSSNAQNALGALRHYEKSKIEGILKYIMEHAALDQIREEAKHIEAFRAPASSSATSNSGTNDP